MTAPTIAVAGFGRCGTTMVMTMLARAGVPPVPGSSIGPFELPAAEWPTLNRANAAGHAFKVLDGWRHVQMPNLDYRFVWLDRDPVQQARSTVKFLRWSGATLEGTDDEIEARIILQLALERPAVLGALRGIGPVTFLTYEQILARPSRAARTLAKVCAGLDFYRPDAVAAVHRRPATCRRDCSVEAMLMERARR